MRLWNALRYSLAGLREALRHPACRLELMAIVVSIPVALVLPLGAVERLLLVGSVVATFVVELLNTSIETVINRIGTERHELSRIAKDMGSAAVFVVAALAAAVWLVIAAPAAWSLVNA